MIESATTSAIRDGILSAFPPARLGNPLVRGIAKHLAALVGIGTMFVLNLGVSFTLSLYTAARAFELPRGFLWTFARTLGRRLARSPGSFFLPPGATAQPPTTGR